jgi:hypothetical protein
MKVSMNGYFSIIKNCSQSVLVGKQCTGVGHETFNLLQNALLSEVLFRHFNLGQNFRHFCLKCLQTFWLKDKTSDFFMLNYNLIDLKMVLQTFCLKRLQTF